MNQIFLVLDRKHNSKSITLCLYCLRKNTPEYWKEIASNRDPFPHFHTEKETPKYVPTAASVAFLVHVKKMPQSTEMHEKEIKHLTYLV